MTKFQSSVKSVAELYDMPEDAVAMAFIDLFGRGVFDWRGL